MVTTMKMYRGRMKHRVTAVEKFVHPSLRESGKNDPPPPTQTRIQTIYSDHFTIKNWNMYQMIYT